MRPRCYMVFFSTVCVVLFLPYGLISAAWSFLYCVIISTILVWS